MLRMLSLALALLLAGAACGQSYRVDPAGGPLTLPEEVAAAAEVWNDAIDASELPSAVRDEAMLRQDPSAPAVIAFGDSQRMGPDLVSVTISREETSELEVRVNPDLYRNYPAALLHELGLLLGLPSSNVGVMDPLLVAADQEQAEPGARELGALLAAMQGIAGDLDGDGTVGIADLAQLGRSFGQRGVNLAADLDSNGVVDETDLELLRETYQFRRPQPPGEPEGEGVANESDTGPGDEVEGQSAEPAPEPGVETEQGPPPESADEPVEGPANEADGQ